MADISTSSTRRTTPLSIIQSQCDLTSFNDFPHLLVLLIDFTSQVLVQYFPCDAHVVSPAQQPFWYRLQFWPDDGVPLTCCVKQLVVGGSQALIFHCSCAERHQSSSQPASIPH